jgi:hypothetical protein
METLEQLKNRHWWNYLGEDLQELLTASEFIFLDVESWGEGIPDGKNKFHDYSFVVFPAAKAYEPFLKKLFLSLGFITEEDYYGKHFRIGKALNPSLPKELARESVYNRMVQFLQSHALADKLWDTWRLSRNLTFHWFPNEKNAITLPEAGERIEMIIDAMDQAFTECKVDTKT